MALTNAQMKDAVLLASLIDNAQKSKDDALRQADINTQLALRRVKQNNALNGINGGYEESTYLRAQSAGNANKAAISAQFDPTIAEYQSYLDRLRARQVGRGGPIPSDPQPIPSTPLSYSYLPYYPEAKRQAEAAAAAKKAAGSTLPSLYRTERRKSDAILNRRYG